MENSTENSVHLKQGFPLEFLSQIEDGAVEEGERENRPFSTRSSRSTERVFGSSNASLGSFARSELKQGRRLL